MKMFGAALLSLVVGLACTDPSPVAPSQCLQPPLPEGPAVAQVGVFPITTAQIVTSITAQGPAALRRYADPPELRTYVEDQVRLELLAQAALERGLDKDPEVIDAARKIMVRKLLERDLGSAGLQNAGVVVSEEKLQAYYERYKNKYRYPAMRRIQHIQLTPDDKGQTLAATLIVQLGGKGDTRALFRELATRYSRDRDGKERGGEQPFRSHEELAEEYGSSFANEAFALEPGALAPAPVQSTLGWHVLRVLAARDELERPLEEVREDIRERLLKDERAKAFDVYLAELRTRYPVAVYEERVQEIARQLAEMQKVAKEQQEHP